MTVPRVELEHVSVAFSSQLVLNDINFRVFAGETVAILGANGSGKSTLVKAFLGLVPLTSGQIRLFGQSLAQFHHHRQIGYVPQRLGAASRIPATVTEIVATGRLSGRMIGFPARRADKKAVAQAIAAVGLHERAHSVAGNLSGGQQQRVLIARALAAEPQLLVMDEPTAGVDAATQETFATVLSNLSHQGITVIMVAHELGPLEPLIRRTIVIDHGRIAHDGPPLKPEPHHDHPDHDHVHPHAPEPTSTAAVLPPDFTPDLKTP